MINRLIDKFLLISLLVACVALLVRLSECKTGHDTTTKPERDLFNYGKNGENLQERFDQVDREMRLGV